MITSPNLLSIARRISGPSAQLGAILSGPSYATRYTTNGTTWSSDVTTTSGPWVGFVKVGSDWFGVTSDAKFWKSSDGGATWTQVGTTGSNPVYLIKTANRFVVGRDTHNYSISTDLTGTSWTSATITGITGSSATVLWDGSLIFVFTSDGYVRSATEANADSNSWTSQPFPGGNLLGSDYFAGSYIVGSNYGGNGILASPTMTTPWPQVASTGSESVYDFAHSPTACVGVGSGSGRGIIYTSASGDPTTWTKTRDVASGQLFKVTFDTQINKFIAVGGSSGTSGGIVLTAPPDGQTWTVELTAQTPSFNTVGS
jgi:hypothetical protein